jgi:hypothetical protein
MEPTLVLDKTDQSGDFQALFIHWWQQAQKLELKIALSTPLFTKISENQSNVDQVKLYSS